MKKLMTALSSAAIAIFAFGAVNGQGLTSTGFETGAYTAGVAVDTDKDDAGKAADSDTRVWVSATEVESTVMAYGAEGAEAKPTITGVTADELGNNYLAVEGKISRLAQQGGESVEIGDGLYIDTVVRFTASDAEATSPDGIEQGDKLCVWLKGNEEDNTQCTLMVTAGYVYDDSGLVIQPTNYVTTTKIADGSWHRLQVKVMAEIDSDDTQMLGDGFVVYIDGTAVATTTCPINPENYSEYELNPRPAMFMTSGSYSLFPSLFPKSDTSSGSITSLTFNGTGSVDNIAFTQGTDPNPKAIDIADMPAALSGLVENGKEQYGVAGNLEDTAYVFSGDVKAIPAGTYTAIATLLEGWAWADGTTAPTNITWTIASSGSGSDVIDPAKGDVEVTVTAADATDAEAAAKAAITVPSGAAEAVSAADYADYFDYSKVDNGNGTFTVTLTGVKEAVTADVLESAVERLTDDEATTIAVPAGLYYSITPSTGLPISGEAVKGLSTNGAVTITKPGTTAGFYEVKVSATPIE